jgi:hypothetical protein
MGNQIKKLLGEILLLKYLSSHKKNKRGAVAKGSNGFYISNSKVILREK